MTPNSNGQQLTTHSFYNFKNKELGQFSKNFDVYKKTNGSILLADIWLFKVKNRNIRKCVSSEKLSDTVLTLQLLTLNN